MQFIRPYKIEDQAQLIELLRLNTPQYFAVSEENDFMEYLRHSYEHYFIVEGMQGIVGCGGINYFEDHARLSWDIIHPDCQGKGIGKSLTEHRIDEIKQKATVKKIIVRTSQLAFKFYEKMGFKLEQTEKDFWAKGFDLYEMKMIV